LIPLPHIDRLRITDGTPKQRTISSSVLNAPIVLSCGSVKAWAAGLPLGPRSTSTNHGSFALFACQGELRSREDPKERATVQSLEVGMMGAGVVSGFEVRNQVGQLAAASFYTIARLASRSSPPDGATQSSRRSPSPRSFHGPRRATLATWQAKPTSSRRSCYPDAAERSAQGGAKRRRHSTRDRTRAKKTIRQAPVAQRKSGGFLKRARAARPSTRATLPQRRAREATRKSTLAHPMSPGGPRVGPR
jgi:hypothetical protein